MQGPQRLYGTKDGYCRQTLTPEVHAPEAARILCYAASGLHDELVVPALGIVEPHQKRFLHRNLYALWLDSLKQTGRSRVCRPRHACRGADPQ